MSVIPDQLQPEDTGSDGTQVQSTALVPIEAAKPALPQQSLVVEALQGFASSKSRQLGGDIAARMIAASYGDTTAELHRTREDLRRKDDELSKANAQLTETLTQNATLRERLASAHQQRHLKQAAIGLGAILGSIGIPMISAADSRWLGIVLTVLGFGIAGFAYVSGDKRDTP